jgi:hypothetical protein
MLVNSEILIVLTKILQIRQTIQENKVSLNWPQKTAEANIRRGLDPRTRLGLPHTWLRLAIPLSAGLRAAALPLVRTKNLLGDKLFPQIDRPYTV